MPNRQSIISSTLLLAICSDTSLAQTPATQATGAAALYLQAEAAIVEECPAASNLEYSAYPPFGKAWDDMAEKAWNANGKTRELAHAAMKFDHADWPGGKEDLRYLNAMRNLANQLGDAAMYQHLHHDDAGAISTLRDLYHLSDLLREDSPDNTLTRQLVAVGIDALGTYRLMVILPDIQLASDDTKAEAFPLTDARQMVVSLLKAPFAKDVLAIPEIKADAVNQHTFAHARDIFNRVAAERTMAAMSLAAQIFKFQHNRWPKDLEELTAGQIQQLPPDPWGDGKQTFGYQLQQGALPDRSDRPLVFCRFNSKDGLQPRTDTPEFGFYIGDGSKSPAARQKQTGQFRDLTRWSPTGETGQGL